MEVLALFRERDAPPGVHLAGTVFTIRIQSGSHITTNSADAASNKPMDRLGCTAVEIDDCLIPLVEQSPRRSQQPGHSMTNSTAHSLPDSGSAKADLLTAMIQDFRASLATILGYVDLLFDHKLSASDHDSYLLAIKHSGRRLNTLTSDVLDLTKIESGQVRTEQARVYPVLLVEEVLQSYRELAQAKGLSLSAQPTGPIPQTIVSDPLRMRQVLFHLVGNAIKFTEAGGIVVTIRMVDFQTSSPQLAIDVIDSGIGIGPSRIHQIFGPVVASDQAARIKVTSTGLGLVLSRRIARLLGGDLIVNSVRGHGSAFTWTMATGSLDGIPLVHHRDDAAACVSRKINSPRAVMPAALRRD